MTNFEKYVTLSIYNWLVQFCDNEMTRIIQSKVTVTSQLLWYKFQGQGAFKNSLVGVIFF